MKVVYVTGCLGFIGSYITRQCLELGWYVKGVDKITYAANSSLLDEFNSYENFSFIKSDINDLKFLYDCDYIINTAAETHVGNSISNSDDFVRTNINGVHNLLELLRNCRNETSNSPVLLHFSTDEVYGDIVNGSHYETDLLKPSNPYSATKSNPPVSSKEYVQEYLKIDQNTPEQTFATVTSDKIYFLSTDLGSNEGENPINFKSLDKYDFTQEDYIKNIDPKTFSTVRGENLLILLRSIIQVIFTHRHNPLKPIIGQTDYSRGKVNTNLITLIICCVHNLCQNHRGV